MFLWFVDGLWVVCGRDDGYRGARRARGSSGWMTGWIGTGRGMDEGRSCRRNDRTRGRRGKTEGGGKEGEEVKLRERRVCIWVYIYKKNDGAPYSHRTHHLLVTQYLIV